MARVLNRSTVYLSGLQKRFELPGFDGDTHPNTYWDFFRTLVYIAPSASAKIRCTNAGRLYETPRTIPAEMRGELPPVINATMWAAHLPK